MPLERRPLFNPRLLRARLEGFDLPDPDGKRADGVLGRFASSIHH